MRRPRIGARAIALIAALTVMIAGAMIADRLGAPWQLSTAAMLWLTAAAIAMAGLTTRTLRLSTFRMAHHRLGWTRGGSALLAVVLGLGLIAGEATFDAGTAGAAALGLLIFALGYAAPMRRAGAGSLGSFALARYRSRLVSALAGLIAAAVGLGLAAAAAGLALAAYRAIPVIDPSHIRLVVAALLLLMLLPGGKASVAGTAVIVVFVTLAAYALPASVVLMRGDDVPAAALTAVIAAIGGTLPSGEALGLAFAAAGLLALAGTGTAMREPGLARQVSAGAALATLAIAALALFTAFAAARVGADLAERPVQRLPSFIYAEKAQGFVTICGVAPRDSATLERACAGKLDGGLIPAREVKIADGGAGPWMAVALNLPMPLGALAVLAPALLLTALTAAAIRLAVAALIDDGLYRLTRRSGTASGRLALHRLAMIAITLGLVFLEVPPQAGYAPALAILAAGAPAAVLWPGGVKRADWRTPLLLLLAVATIAGLSAAQMLHWPLWMMAAGVLALSVLSVLSFRSKDAEDARAAMIVTGALPGPLLADDEA